jgi:CO/xanthine dehydrogenase FAD-binding subunit
LSLPQYLRPQTLDEAVAALQAYPALRIIAGGTDLYPALGDHVQHTDLLDITGLSGLQDVTLTADGLRIGALATWTDVQAANLGNAYKALAEAGREVGSPQIQNAATVVGNLCNASPAADGTVALMALGAQVEIAGQDGVRIVPVESFVTGVRRVALAQGEIVTALHVPPATGGSAFLKLGARKYLVISIAMVAAHVALDASGRITHAAIAVGSCAPVAKRLPKIEAALLGARRGDVAAVVRPELIDGLAPISDVRADAAYRETVVPVLVRRALMRSMERSDRST